MTDVSLKYLLFGDDRTASAAMHGIASTALSSTSKISGAFGKMGGQIGGEFGELLSRVGEGFDKVGEHGASMGAKIAATGGVLTGIGAALTLGSSKEKAAQDQLAAAIDTTGNVASDYKDKIEEAVKSGEKFAHNAADTKGALAALTLATQDPTKALEDMTIVENLAAQKHESLTAAAGQLAKVYGGSGKILKQYGITLDSTTKQTAALTSAQKLHNTAVLTLSTAQKKLADLEAIDASKAKLSVSNQIALRNAHQAVADAIKQHGEKSVQAQAAEQKLRDEEAKLTAGSALSTAQQIQLRDAHAKVAQAAADLKLKTENLRTAQDKNKTSTENADAALATLGKRLDGQASASVNNWGGKIAVLRTKLSDWTAEMGQRFGPAITATGPILMAAGMAMEMYHAHVAKATLAQTTLGTEAEASAVKVGEADATMAAESQAAGGKMKLGALGAATGFLALGVGIDVAGHKIAAYVERNNSFVKVIDGSKNAIQGLTGALQADGDAAGKATRTYVAAQLQQNGLAAKAEKAGVSLRQMTDGVTGSDQAFGNLIKQWKAGGKPSGDTIAALIAMRGQFNQAGHNAQALGDAINNIPTVKNISLNISEIVNQGNSSTKNKGAAGRASGGPVTAGIPYLVGEHRAEIFVPDQDGRIVPRVTAGGGQTVIQVNVNGQVYGSTRDLAGVVLKGLQQLKGSGTQMGLA